ncbi:MAG: Rab family GTPase [Candidatus Bathyarchaeia archaeon]
MFEKTFKIVLLGEHATGKTSLLRKLIYGEFDAEYLPTIKPEIFEREYSFRNGVIRLIIWDAPGSIEEVDDDFYNGAKAALMLYDVCRKSSLRNLKRWYETLSKFISDKYHIWIVGNKIDLETSRIVGDEQVKEEFRDMDFNYLEISAKTGENVEILFKSILKRLIEAQLEEIKTRLRD